MVGLADKNALFVVGYTQDEAIQKFAISVSRNTIPLFGPGNSTRRHSEGMPRKAKKKKPEQKQQIIIWASWEEGEGVGLSVSVTEHGNKWITDMTLAEPAPTTKDICAL